MTREQQQQADIAKAVAEIKKICEKPDKAIKESKPYERFNGC